MLQYISIEEYADELLGLAHRMRMKRCRHLPLVPVSFINGHGMFDIQASANMSATKGTCVS